MSLAIYAAPFDNSNITNESSDLINQKRQQQHNKTQRNTIKDNFNAIKVNSVLNKIHNRDSDEDDDNFRTFSPPDKPQSSGVDKTISREQMINMTTLDNNIIDSPHSPHSPHSNVKPNIQGNLDLNYYNSADNENKQTEEYYKKIIPSYFPQHKPDNKPDKSSYNISNSSRDSTNSSNDVLLQKMNYMIHLLEDKQDERTNNVTEEVVLYSFLGIFVIFVVDSFARVGKYVR
jgi:hypothetical protein